ncbi:uncharacterized protein KGF55_002164 [Candida pseudojiufengensis]|uniref:uncharacterized protein n=1 Tax=Candida pseudojiufengensis TaxID=497109 RepID=UPI002224E3DB|nr:uncharacterized protein KGF55_002164 [Candida pseudojiufengensis]KAI5964222.1 hypothetical protein KGF55_002164 [Candida pseudojiufengensis]
MSDDTSTTIPKTQKAVYFEKPNAPLEYKDVPVPEPKPTELLVNVLYTGVCATDTHVWSGSFGEVKAHIGGHEGAGKVVKVGSNVKGWKVGDYAGIKWLNGSCMNCEYCEQGAEPNCQEADLSGFTHNGSFQQYATCDAVQAAKIPKDVDLAKVAPILCAGVTVYKALKTADLLAGQWVCISGAAGGLGSLAIQYATAMGYRVIAIDGGADKGEYVKKLGAEVYIDFTTEKDIVEAVKKATNGGPHGVLNVSVSEAAINQSVEYIRPLGKVVLVGLPANAKVIAPVFSSVLKSIQIRGSYVGNRKDTQEALDFFLRGKVECPIKIAGLSEVSKVFDLMHAGKIMGRYVLDTSK